ncbi:MAG: restriction endonuclease [Fimbriimonadaceae bacterium]|nr:restriction endonuclease [Fimbriimonadaceae bacterium]
MSKDWRNKLYFGDNLGILRNHVESESVDLVYLDPPFNSKADYNVLFKNASGEDNAAQAHAFKDTWEWDEAAAEAFHELMVSPAIPTNLKNLMEALKVFLTGDTGKKGNSMMAYLTMMALRLVELHRVLKPTGSLYLHCDPTASHYIKLILDSLFGFRGYQNEITWQRTSAHNTTSRRFGAVADIIFFYTKGNDYTFLPPRSGHDPEYVKDFYRHTDTDGRQYRLHQIERNEALGLRQNLVYEYKGYTPSLGWMMERQKLESLDQEGKLYWSKTGRPQRKIYLDEVDEPVVGCIWDDIPPIQAQASERLGYPTQKPEALLERIIRASSNEDDVILDPFCGCGTTIAVAEKLNRRWIGIDVTYVAVDLMERRLIDQFTPNVGVQTLANITVQKRRHALKTYFAKGEDELNLGLRTGLKPFEVIGVPQTADDARFLFQNDPYQFEWWAIAMLGAQGKEYKKGADQGIDGIITFTDTPTEYHRAVISVKGGKLNATMLRDLKGVMQREKAVIGILVTNDPPTGPMKTEAASAGRWNSKLHAERSYPCIQILTAEEILAGKDADLPRWGLDTFKKAGLVKKTIKQDELF